MELQVRFTVALRFTNKLVLEDSIPNLDDNQTKRKRVYFKNKLHRQSYFECLNDIFVLLWTSCVLEKRNRTATIHRDMYHTILASQAKVVVSVGLPNLNFDCVFQLGRGERGASTRPIPKYLPILIATLYYN